MLVPTLAGLQTNRGASVWWYARIMWTQRERERERRRLGVELSQILGLIYYYMYMSQFLESARVKLDSGQKIRLA